MSLTTLGSKLGEHREIISKTDESSTNFIRPLYEAYIYVLLFLTLCLFFSRIVYNNTIVSRHKYSSHSLTYLSQKQYIFEKELSCKNCDPVRDTVTNVNLPFLVSFKFVCSLRLRLRT